MPIGPWEMAILFVIVLIIFGPKSLPKIGQALGRGIREFKDAARGLTEMDDDAPRKQNGAPQPQQQVPDSSNSTTTTQTSSEASTSEHRA